MSRYHNTGILLLAVYNKDRTIGVVGEDEDGEEAAA